MRFQYFFELLPVVLAFVAAVSCSIRYHRDRRHHDRLAMALAILASLMLIAAQTSWWATVLYQHSLQGTEFSNFIWTAFNSLTMIIYIIMASPWRMQK